MRCGAASPGDLVSLAATYNPYRGGTFTDRASGEELLSAAVVLLDERGVRYSQ